MCRVRSLGGDWQVRGENGRCSEGGEWPTNGKNGIEKTRSLFLTLWIWKEIKKRAHYTNVTASGLAVDCPGGGLPSAPTDRLEDMSVYPHTGFFAAREERDDSINAAFQDHGHRILDRGGSHMYGRPPHHAGVHCSELVGHSSSSRLEQAPSRLSCPQQSRKCCNR